MRSFLVAVVSCIVTIVVTVVAGLFAGPVRSGALLLLLPSGRPRVNHDLPESYHALHKGHVDLSTGLYIREDEDIVVHGTPPLVLRRTYLSNYDASKQFGIGTTHNGEWYLIGDGERFQWAALILADGGRIQFERTSPGTSYSNGVFEHRATPTHWQGARLGWTGLGWAMRERDGTLVRFQACTPHGVNVCSIVQMRDADGHTIQYRRDRSGHLTKIEADGKRWIAFEYDGQNRITRASASTKADVRYEYDPGGHLSAVTDSSGGAHRYTYTSRHQMATIEETDTTIVNSYDAAGRCVRQVNRFPDAADYIFDFTYHVNKDAVVQTDSTESDGSWSRLTFAASGYTIAETRGMAGKDPATITHDRDPSTNIVTALTVTCPDRTGRPLSHTSPVIPETAEWVEWDLLQMHCFRSRRHVPR